jgi:hypothetical protein
MDNKMEIAENNKKIAKFIAGAIGFEPMKRFPIYFQHAAFI